MCHDPNMLACPPPKSTQPQKRCGVNYLPHSANNKMSHHSDVIQPINAKNAPPNQILLNQRENFIFTLILCKLCSMENTSNRLYERSVHHPTKKFQCRALQFVVQPENYTICLFKHRYLPNSLPKPVISVFTENST